VVEQGTHKPLVTSPNLVATIFYLYQMYLFLHYYYLPCVRSVVAPSLLMVSLKKTYTVAKILLRSSKNIRDNEN
jgi:hypothetical protein